jgi:uncharacterized repeat protein (TIGR03803 family)
LSISAVTSAQPSPPPISQVFVFFCTPGFLTCPLGFDPILSPIQLSDGNLYAVTFWAGQGNPNAGGTVVRTSVSGQGLVLHTFEQTGGLFLGGENPAIAFVKGPDGDLYGVTESGGTHTFGVMYKLARNGNFQILHNFCSLQNCTDAPVPITLANDGNFYGVSYLTFFRISPQGTWTQIATLGQSLGGASRLIQASDGNFYAVGNRVAFRLTPSGQLTVLHQFVYPAFPTSPLIQASDGNLYGATGGSGSGTGIFRMSLSGDLAFIHQMTDSEGYSPVQLLQASDGNLWGISDFRNGSFFTISLSGVSIQSEAFNCNATGCGPLGMIEGTDGNLYGVAGAGGNAPPGDDPLGTIFKIAAGLPH